MTARLLRLPAVLDRVGLKERTLLALVKERRFPEPVRPTERTVAWIETEVDGWIEAKIAERDERKH